MKREIPNPAGNKGKPISLAGHKFDDVLRKMLATPAPPKDPQPTKKKSAKKR